MEIDTAIERKMDLYLKYTIDTNLHPLPTLPNPPFHLQPPLLGYKTESGPGVVALFGSDHGGSHSQNILQLNVESSGYRRQRNKPEVGTIIIPFARMRCSTDDDKIISLAAPVVKRGLKVFEDKMLVAVKKGSWLKCIFVDKNTTHFHFEGNQMSQVVQGNVTVLPLDGIPPTIEPTQVFPVFCHVNVYLVSDLKAQFVIQGRGYKSPNRCLKCKSDRFSWSIHDREGIGWTKLLNNADVQRVHDNSDFNDDYGYECLPLWGIPVNRCIVPQLHVMMGTINDTYFKGVLPNAMMVDVGGDEEIRVRLKYVDTQQRYAAMSSAYHATLEKLMQLSERKNTLPDKEPE